MMTIPTRLRQREILDAQLTQCRQVDNSFARGAVAGLRWLTEGGAGPLSGVWVPRTLTRPLTSAFTASRPTSRSPSIARAA
jgi:hypothetical protein